MSAVESVHDIETPAIIVDRDRLLRNIERVQSVGRTHGLAVRPHIKTHKCVTIAELQIRAGACGITASKPTEAEVFIEAGVKSVTVAYPLIDVRKATHLMDRALRMDCDLAAIADSHIVVDCLESAAKETGAKAGVYVKIDVGLHRVGLRPDAEELIPIARRLQDCPHLHFRGLLSHAGQAYGAKNVAGVREVANSERRILMDVKSRLLDVDVPVEEISVGSTPTVLAVENFDGATEIRPGNYVYFDLTAVRLGIARLSDVSLSVLASVVSANDRYAIVDAGSKVLSSDAGPHGTEGVEGFGLAFPEELTIGEGFAKDAFPVAKLSEEHGFLRLDGRRLRVGDRLRILPNHSCPVTNLADEVVLLEDNGVQRWPIAAAGKVR